MQEPLFVSGRDGGHTVGNPCPVVDRLLLYEADNYGKLILARFNVEWLSGGTASSTALAAASIGRCIARAMAVSPRY